MFQDRLPARPWGQCASLTTCRCQGGNGRSPSLCCVGWPEPFARLPTRSTAMNERHSLACAFAAVLAASLAGQSWSSFPYTPAGSVSASPLGLLAVQESSGTMVTQEFDGSNWLPRSPASSPPPRVAFSLGFDTARQRVVLFGGAPSPFTSHFSDTWEWTGTTWQPRLTFAYPTGRAAARMAFDTARSRMVLFGGSNTQGTLGDTWEYDGGNWFSMPTPGGHPSARVDHGLAFDPARQVTILFGGSSTGSSWSQLGDTWAWNGTTWTQRFPASAPPPRSEHGTCFDPYSGGVLVFGGLSLPPNQVYLNDAYAWNGTNWITRSYLVTPTPRVVRSMVFDEVHQAIVILGGYNGSNLTDGWVFPGAVTASAQPYGTGCGGSGLSAQPPVLGQGTTATLTSPVPTNLAFMMVGFSRTSFGPFSLPLALDGYGLPGCNLLQDASVTAFAPCQANGTNLATFSISIPNLQALSGVRILLQGWVPYANANQGGLVLSNGLDLLVGS